MARNRVIRTTKYKLSEIKDSHPEIYQEATELFVEYERYKTTLVEEYRKLQEAVADFDISRAMTTKSVGRFFRKVGEAIGLVKVEPQWWVYRDKEGNIILESAFTERDYRNATRAQKAGLSREVQSEDGAELFEQDEEEGKHEDESIGFSAP